MGSRPFVFLAPVRCDFLSKKLENRYRRGPARVDSDGIRGSDCFLISRLTAHAGRKARYCGSHLENAKPSVDPSCGPDLAWVVNRTPRAWLHRWILEPDQMFAGGAGFVALGALEPIQ
jgi:hypothetical protein